MSDFSVDDFKKWMSDQSGFSIEVPRGSRYVGLEVEPNIPKRKLGPKICVREGTLSELVEDFVKKGGKVIEIDGMHLVVEVDSGSFSIPQHCIRRHY
jgi:hypothetical protein